MIDKETVLNRCQNAAEQMRRDALKMALAAGNAHLGGGLSLIEIMAVLYLGIMRYDLANPNMEERDRLIFSKGHGVLALYTALNQAGFVSNEDLLTFKSNHTYLSGHPSMNSEKGIEFSSGSLGQGLSLAVGCSLAMKRKKNEISRVFVILGDGECDEGSIWEAAASASHFGLSNIVTIIDENGLQYDGKTEEVLSMESLTKKWESFGWSTIDVDGHNVSALYDALTASSDKPLAVIAHTVKGKGVSFMENNPLWHHARFTREQYDMAMAELEGRA